jgi:hypothetical protein
MISKRYAPMNSRQNSSGRERGRGALPFMVEFVKFATGFVIIIACALVGLHFASVASVNPAAVAF